MADDNNEVLGAEYDPSFIPGIDKDQMRHDAGTVLNTQHNAPLDDSIAPSDVSPLDVLPYGEMANAAVGAGRVAAGALADAGSFVVNHPTVTNRAGMVGSDLLAAAKDLAMKDPSINSIQEALQKLGYGNSVKTSFEGGITSGNSAYQMQENGKTVLQNQSKGRLYADGGEVSAQPPASGGFDPDAFLAAAPSPAPQQHQGPGISAEGIQQNALAAPHDTPVDSTQIGQFNPDDFITQHDYNTQSSLEDKYGSTSESLKALGEGALRGAIGPLGPLAEKGLGVKDEDILGREKAHPVLSGVGEFGTLAAGMFTGTGEAVLAEKAGLAAAKAIGLGAAEGTAAKIAATATKAAVENMLIQGSDEASKMIINDPDQTAQSALTDIGLSGLIGGGTGAVLGSISPLWKATMGNKLGQVVEDMKGGLKYHMENPDPLTAVTDELTNHYEGVKSAADEVYGASGLKGQALAKAMPEMNNDILRQTATVTDDLDRGLQKLSRDPHAGMLEEKVAAYKSAITTDNPEQIFNATQDLKQQLQEWGKYNAKMSPLSERAFRDTSKELAYKLRGALEDTDVWGKAAETQQSVNRAFSDYLPKLKDFEKKFTTEIAGERTVDQGKVQTYLNQLDKASSTTKKQMLGNFLDASEKYKDVISKLHESVGSESPIAPSSLTNTMRTLSERTTGGKLADYLVKKGIAHAGGSALGALAGGAAGHSIGSGEMGALIGEHALGPLFSSALNGIAKPILSAMNNASAARAAIDMGVAATNGHNLIQRAATSVFKAGREVLPKAAMPSDKDLAKLDKQVAYMATSPDKMERIGGDVGHYMPDHARALSQTASTATNYLNSLRPAPLHQAPLDSKSPVNTMQKAAYNNALRIAQQPLTILDRIQKGTLTPQDVHSLRAMYPALYTKLSNHLTEEMTNHLAKGDMVPYKTRIGLSLFLGQPMDSTMTPSAILAAQPLSPPQNQPQGQPGKPPAASSVKGLSKLSTSYQTPNQSREAKRAVPE